MITELSELGTFLLVSMWCVYIFGLLWLQRYTCLLWLGVGRLFILKYNSSTSLQVLEILMLPNPLTFLLTEFFFLITRRFDVFVKYSAPLFLKTQIAPVDRLGNEQINPNFNISIECGVKKRTHDMIN